MNENIIEMKNVKTYFYTHDGVVKALDGLNLKIQKEKIIGIVGETACGKSMTAYSIMSLIPTSGRIIEGEIIFNGKNLLEKSEKDMENIRGKEISMIFQEPTSSLNPVFSIGEQILDVIKVHEKINKKEAKRRTLNILRMVGLPDPERTINQYPHELSGGMQQRVMIAMALSCGPSLLIADEPTTALDVTISKQILVLIDEMRMKFQMSVLLISHNLGIIAEISDNVGVMYAGSIIEFASTRDFFRNPKHPYSRGLLEAIPKGSSKEKKLITIKGSVPNALNLPTGCTFHPRCKTVSKICSKNKPEFIKLDGEHYVACHLHNNDRMD